MNLDLLENAAEALGEMLDQVVFVGAATIVLWISDPGARPPTATTDVDVVTSVATTSELVRFESRMRQHGFQNDGQSGVICRWIHPDKGVKLDAMPRDANVFGFASNWQAASLEHAAIRSLQSGRIIRCASAPYLLAMKLEAFENRGGGDYWGSKDFEGIVTLIDGRSELVNEVSNSERSLRQFVASRLSAMRAPGSAAEERKFKSGLYGAIPGPQGVTRVDSIVIPRIDALIDSEKTDDDQS